MLITISPLLQRYVKNWQARGHQVDYELLVYCAYYPRGKCQDCSLKAPNPECNRSHILEDRLDRSTQQPPTQPNPQTQSKKKKKDKVWGVKLEDLMKILSPQEKQLVMKMMGGGE